MIVFICLFNLPYFFGVEDELSRTPPVDSKVQTPDGVGFVKEISPLSGFCKVSLPDKAGEIIKVYHRDSLKVIFAKGKRANAEEKDTFDDEENIPE